MKIEKNSVHQAEITGYSTEGEGICHIGNMVCFVKGAVRGDICQIRVIKVLRNMGYGIIESIETPSPHRVPSACPSFPKCGGCNFQNMSYEEELWHKKDRVTQAMSRLGGFTVGDFEMVGATEIQRYRNKAQFPIGVEDGKTCVGFFRSHSHTIVKTQDCLLQTEDANILAKTVCQWADKYSIIPYDAEAKKGVLRHCYVRSGQGGIQLCLVVSKKKINYLDELVKMCRAAVPALVSVVVNLNREATNRIMGDREYTIYGEAGIWDTICENKFFISPQSFYQVNKVQAQAIYTKAAQLAQLDKSKTVLDLYCGIGTMTLHMAKEAKSAYGIEIVQTAVDNARENALTNGIENVEFICNDAASGAAALVSRGIVIDTVVVDPPRKGLDPQAIEAICEINPKSVVYVSCDPATMARDLKELALKGYTLKSLSAYDMFPRTANVECVTLVERL